MSMNRLRSPEAGVLWGVRHSQGIKWCDSEKQAREDLADMVARDTRRRSTAQGKVRLVCRTLGPLEIVENPHDSGDPS